MSAVQFITLIRLPFIRAEFIDPPQADWNASKDRALWKVISKSSKTSDLNWTELASKFQVPESFLLQQAAWLYERHLEHVRTQMKKVGSANAPAASGSGSGNTAVGGVPMQRGGSHGSRSSRAPSALSMRARDGPSPRAETSTPVSAFAPAQPPLSRTPSTNTITQSKAHIQSNPNRPQVQHSARPSFTGPRPSIPVATATAPQKQDVDDDSPDSAALSPSSSSSSDSEMEAPLHRSQLFKRPPRFQKQRPRDLPSYDEDPDEADDPEHSDEILLPFAQPQRTPAAGENVLGNTEAGPSDTSRGVRQKIGQHQRVNSERTDASSSLASSASDAPKPKAGPGPISPRHRAELARLSPRAARSRKDGSEGAPSMGSSFSDLDDASISQSALEEALLSNIHAGRMSTFSQLRSRYL